MAWKWIRISLDSRMVVLMESGTKTKSYQLVSQIACICVSLFLVLNVHIPLYNPSRAGVWILPGQTIFFCSRSHLMLLVISHHSRIHFSIYSSVPEDRFSDNFFSPPKNRVSYGSATSRHMYDMVPYSYLVRIFLHGISMLWFSICSQGGIFYF